MKFVFSLFIFLVVNSTAHASDTVCSGRVQVFGTEREVAVSFSDLKPQSYIGLSSPIASDLEPETGFRVVTSKTINNKIYVKAQYDDGFIGEVSFIFVQSPSGRHLINFKGVENDIPFGPSVLKCD